MSVNVWLKNVVSIFGVCVRFTSLWETPEAKRDFIPVNILTLFLASEANCLEFLFLP